jgi:hypothetical protein
MTKEEVFVMARQFDGIWILCLKMKKILEGLGDPYCINCFHDQQAFPEGAATRDLCIRENCVSSVDQIIEWRDKALAMDREAEDVPEDTDGALVYPEDLAERYSFNKGAGAVDEKVSTAGGSSSANTSTANGRKSQKKGEKVDDGAK